ncbi:MAG: NUDIX domain-containing protein [Candidatus Woesearchaeota archaeon]
MATKQVAAGAVVYDSSRKKFLLLKHRLGNWAFAQGKKEGREKLETTLSRELKEETGLSIIESFGPVCEVLYSFRVRKKKIEKKVVFWAVLTDGEVVLSSEHLGYIWVSYKQALRLVKFENHVRALQESYSVLRKEGLV